MKFGKLAAGVAVAGAVVLGGIGVASASVQAESCTPDRVCIYKHNNYGTKLEEKAPLKGTTNVSAVANDEMSSWRNLTNVDARWYHDAGGGGRCVTMRAGTSDDDINSRDDNKLSSWNTQGRC
ncbi:peptidase inhibitor family I36 protein [Saccharothrix australiensis]|uniref:Peptidase inhibitor family I36 n=1 Tax=Saccharothrix australiensis TaxID=2072 RepID=A0A495VYZ3_9PSEU|nr:peptidase inhibitor family I36 protein [Saccharothrix australiensis]RKT54424.1 peptidase inhibitor family I36 [Saccharothrix australiensis]